MAIAMEKLLRRETKFRTLSAIFLAGLILAGFLLYEFHYPAFNEAHLEKFQVRMLKMVEEINDGELHIEESRLSAFDGEYNGVVRLPLPYWNLSHKGLVYTRREDNGAMSVIFLAGRDSSGAVTKAYIYNTSGQNPQFFGTNISPGWFLMRE